MTYPLLSERLSIEPLSVGDMEVFVKYRQNPEVARYQSWEPTYSTKQALELIESQAGVTIPTSGNWLQLAIHDRQTGALLGDLALHRISELDAVFEIGFTISPEHQHNGFAKEAAKRLMSFLFSEVNATKLIAHTDSRNTRSGQLLSALGFRRVSERGWSEQFKGELVRVEYFEAIRVKAG